MTSLKPCPFCGKTPNEDGYYQNQGYKYGGIQCCIQGPEVRTSYADWPAWKEAAIKAWNERASDANGKLAKAEAKIKALTEALRRILENYASLVNSGDVGNYQDIELDADVVLARRALKKAGAE